MSWQKAHREFAAHFARPTSGQTRYRNDLPDIADHTGDFDGERPIYRSEVSDAMAPDMKAQAYIELEARVKSMRNGDLDGIKTLPFNLDGQSADFVAEFYGDPNEAFAALDPGDANLIYEAGARNIEATGWRDIEEGQRRQAFGDALFSEFAELYPDHAQSPQAEISDAAERAFEAMRSMGYSARMMLGDDEQRRMLYEEIVHQMDTGPDGSGAYDYSDEVNRTGGIHGGGGGHSGQRQRREPTQEEDASNFADEVRAMQRKGGWY